MLEDGRWSASEPLIEACRPRQDAAPARPAHMAAIIWRHENGVKWRVVPAIPGPWWMVAQIFIHWPRRDVWGRPGLGAASLGGQQKFGAVQRRLVVEAAIPEAPVLLLTLT
jgi:hypothetical protein